MKPTAEASMTVELNWKRFREDARTRFERVWRDHGPALSRVVASYARPGADQQDLAQDVALALWNALPRFRGESSEKTFVLRVAHNRGVHHALRRSPTEADLDAVPDPRPAPDAEAAKRQDMERLFQSIRRLPLSQREVLALSLEDLPYEDIGSVLGITAGNVAVRLTRARAALRAMLEEEHP